MSIYKTWNVGKGGVRYMKDGKLIKATAVPQHLLQILKPGDTLDTEATPPSPPAKICIYCGHYAKMSRMVNMQTVYLCDEHYYDKNIGQIAGRLKELNDE